MGFFTDYKPVIIQGIMQAIQNEERYVESAMIDLSNKLKSGEEVVASSYERRMFSNAYTRDDWHIAIHEPASSKEMFQALKSVSFNAEYFVNDDKATGIVNNYELSLCRTSVAGAKFITIHAVSKGRGELIRDVISDFKLTSQTVNMTGDNP